MNNAIDITAAQRKIILALLRKHLPNTTAWVYGSRATWNARPQSDLDMVVFTTQTQERGVSDLRDAFEESALPFRVDLFVWDTVPESFHKQIEAEHVVLVEKEERGGAGQWREITFAQLLTGPVRNGIYKKKEFHGSGVKIVNMGELFAHPRLRSVDMKRVELSETEKRRFNLEKGDLLFARRSLVAEGAGKCSIVLDADEPTTFESSIIRARPDPTKANPLFLYYYFNSRLGLQALDSIRRQVAVAGITGSDLVQLNISVPPLPEQRVIAHILGTLDDKIELNRRMNETLEEMARALFKSWFVDFDPVHAKAALKHHAANQAPRQGASTPATEAARSGITPPLRGSRQAKGASPQARRRGEIRRLYSPQTLQKAQALRHNQADAEGLLWHYLRNKQLGGYKFRRQQPIGPYIADFACLSQKLLIELDGSQHATRQDYDEKRDAFLQEKGYRVLRFWNNEVFENCFGVLERIYAVLPHHPPLEGGSKDGSLSGRGDPPPQQPAPDGLAVATPPQGGSDWTVERARAYLDVMDPSIAALFPDRFVDSELGEMPEGWGARMLGDCFHLTMGQSPPGNTYNDDGDGLPFFQGSADFGFRYPKNKRFCAVPTRIAEQNDTLVSVRAPVGDINMALEKCCIGRGIAALRHKSGSRSFTYYSIWAIQQELRQYEHTGTVFGAINKKQFEMLKTMEPLPELIHVFESLVGSLDEYIKAHVSESRTLTALRDTLLPKLISGELRVEDSGRFLDSVSSGN